MYVCDSRPSPLTGSTLACEVVTDGEPHVHRARVSGVGPVTWEGDAVPLPPH